MLFLLMIINAFYAQSPEIFDGRRYEKGANIVLEKELKEEGRWKMKIQILMDEERLDARIHSAVFFNIKNIKIGIGKQNFHFGVSPKYSLFVSREAPPLTSLSFTGKNWCIFFSDLGRERWIKGAKLFGSKVSFKKGDMRLSLFRMVMFEGEGGARIKNIKDFFAVLSGENIEPDTNQIAGLELSLKKRDTLFYIQWGGEDEAGHLPSKPALIFGVDISKKQNNITLEFSYLEACWYRHHLYRCGYTYKGAVIGHQLKRPEDHNIGALRICFNRGDYKPFIEVEVLKKENIIFYTKGVIRIGRLLFLFGRREGYFFSLRVEL